MSALFMMTACVERSANGSIDCCRHTISTIVVATGNLPVAPGTCNLNKWQNPHYAVTNRTSEFTTGNELAGLRNSVTTRLSTAVLC